MTVFLSCLVSAPAAARSVRAITMRWCPRRAAGYPSRPPHRRPYQGNNGRRSAPLPPRHMGWRDQRAAGIGIQEHRSLLSPAIDRLPLPPWAQLSSAPKLRPRTSSAMARAAGAAAIVDDDRAGPVPPDHRNPGRAPDGWRTSRAPCRRDRAADLIQLPPLTGPGIIEGKGVCLGSKRCLRGHSAMFS